MYLTTGPTLEVTANRIRKSVFTLLPAKCLWNLSPQVRVHRNLKRNLNRYSFGGLK